MGRIVLNELATHPSITSPSSGVLIMHAFDYPKELSYHPLPTPPLGSTQPSLCREEVIHSYHPKCRWVEFRKVFYPNTFLEGG